MDADSTLNFGSDDEGSEPSTPTDVHKDDVEADFHAGSEESIDTCMSCSSSGEEELWELSDSEASDETDDEGHNDSSETVRELVYGVTFFIILSPAV
jgi:hypothetical protein